MNTHAKSHVGITLFSIGALRGNLEGRSPLSTLSESGWSLITFCFPICATRCESPSGSAFFDLFQYGIGNIFRENAEGSQSIRVSRHESELSIKSRLVGQKPILTIT